MRRELVYSTNPKVHAKMCELSGRKNRLHTPIMSSTRVGRSPEAMVVCESTNQAAKTSLFAGQYKAATHIGRRKKKLLDLPTLKALRKAIG